MFLSPLLDGFWCLSYAFPLRAFASRAAGEVQKINVVLAFLPGFDQSLGPGFGGWLVLRMGMEKKTKRNVEYCACELVNQRLLFFERFDLL